MKANENANLLKIIRADKGVPPKDIVRSVRELYPKYDKTLLSKCEHGDAYGIALRSDAMDALIERYAPERIEEIKRKRRGGHRLTCRVSCRLEDAEYAEVVKALHEDGFDTVQSWLAFNIRKYLDDRKTIKS